MYASTFENNLLDAVTFVVMAPVNAVYALLWLIWLGCKLLWPYRRYIAKGVALAAAVAVCAACPALALGLLTTAAYGLISYPMHKAVR